MGEVESKQCGAREQNAALWFVKKIVSSFFWILHPLNFFLSGIKIRLWQYRDFGCDMAGNIFCCMEFSKFCVADNWCKNCCKLHFELQDRIQMAKMITWRKLQFVVLSNLKLMTHCPRERRLRFAYTSLDKKSEEFEKGKNVLFQKKDECKRSQIWVGDHDAMSQHVTHHVTNLRILRGCEWISLSLYIIS